MRLCILIVILLVVVVAVSSTRNDVRNQAQGLYRMTDTPPGRLGGVKGGHTTQRHLRKGEYICGKRICKLRPGEVPKWCEGGECQYNIGHEILRK